MSSRVKKVSFGFFMIFVVMFLFRLGYGYQKYPENEEMGSSYFQSNFSDGDNNRMNIASSKYKKSVPSNAGNQQVVSVDQKYEKTANMGCRTTDFDEDEKQIRQTIKDNNSIIQFQQKSGNEGNRMLHLQIGVQPDLFDQFIASIKDNQRVVSFNVTKKDKTNEYRELNSKIKTLQGTRASLQELKSKGGNIEEFINLENRILELDNQLQQFGVMMGSFDTENEFCTVNISLQEGKTRKISFYQRFKVALEWTIRFYLMLIVLFTGILLSSYLLINIVDKLRLVIPKIRDKYID